MLLYLGPRGAPPKIKTQGRKLSTLGYYLQPTVQSADPVVVLPAQRKLRVKVSAQMVSHLLVFPVSP